MARLKNRMSMTTSLLHDVEPVEAESIFLGTLEMNKALERNGREDDLGESQFGLTFSPQGYLRKEPGLKQIAEGCLSDPSHSIFLIWRLAF